MRKQATINQASFIDPIQKPNDPLVSIDARATGILKTIIDENQTHQLYFMGNVQAVDDKHYFSNEYELINFLKEYDEIETWEIMDKRSGKKVYFHREPFGEMERFTSEKELNKTLSSEGGGRWIIEYQENSPNNFKRIGMMDVSGWWQTAFLKFTTQASFEKANKRYETEQLVWRKQLGWFFLGLLAGGLTSIFYRNTLTQSASELEDDEEITNDLCLTKFAAQEEMMEQSFSRISSPLQSSFFLSQQIIQATISYSAGLSLTQRTGVAHAAPTLSLLNFFMGGLPTSLAEDTTGECNNVLEANLLGNYDISYPQELGASDEVVYIIRGLFRSSIDILDVKTPSNPVLIGSYNETNRYIFNADFSENMAYVTTTLGRLSNVLDDKFQVINLMNPVNPFLQGSVNISGYAGFVGISDNIAYVEVARKNSTDTFVPCCIQIIDVRNPIKPSLLGSFNMEGYDLPNKIVVSKGIAYIAALKSGLLIVNVSIPFDPFLLSCYNMPDVVIKDVVVSENIAYLTYSSNTIQDSGVYIINIASPAKPMLLGKYNNKFSDPYKTTVSGNLLYLLDKTIEILDISTPSNPQQLGCYYEPSSPFVDILAVKDNLYVIYVSDGFQIYKFIPLTPNSSSTDNNSSQFFKFSSLLFIVPSAIVGVLVIGLAALLYYKYRRRNLNRYEVDTFASWEWRRREEDLQTQATAPLLDDDQTDLGVSDIQESTRSDVYSNGNRSLLFNSNPSCDNSSNLNEISSKYPESESKPPQEYECPVLFRLMPDVVILNCGHSLSAEAVETIQETHGCNSKCHECRAPIKLVVPNYTLRSAIANWIKKHPDYDKDEDEANVNLKR